MAKSGTERQAAFRKRARENDRQLSVWIDHRAMLALQRLARREGVTQAAVIERLILAADDAVTRKLDPEAPEWSAYFGKAASVTSDGPTI